jgi:hypothetical protein
MSMASDPERSSERSFEASASLLASGATAPTRGDLTDEPSFRRDPGKLTYEKHDREVFEAFLQAVRCYEAQRPDGK